MYNDELEDDDGQLKFLAAGGKVELKISKKNEKPQPVITDPSLISALEQLKDVMPSPEELDRISADIKALQNELALLAEPPPTQYVIDDKIRIYWDHKSKAILCVNTGDATKRILEIKLSVKCKVYPRLPDFLRFLAKEVKGRV